MFGDSLKTKKVILSGGTGECYAIVRELLGQEVDKTDMQKMTVVPPEKKGGDIKEISVIADTVRQNRYKMGFALSPAEDAQDVGIYHDGVKWNPSKTKGFIDISLNSRWQKKLLAAIDELMDLSEDEEKNSEGE